MTRTGLDSLRSRDFANLHGKTIGVVCNQASIAADCRHLLDLLLPFHRAGTLKVGVVFGPEHGLYGHTQDNMIEWEGVPDPRTGYVIHSLYGQHRKPTPEMLEGIDMVVVDLPDVGSRYYTFVWTMCLCIEACRDLDIPVLVLDRPNPIGGELREGPWLEDEFRSFVGHLPVPARHGLTVGELALYAVERHYPGATVQVAALDGWARSRWFDQTGQPWALPSPNMPCLETATVYPGACLLEGTNMSEGRGTTRPFEIFGAPWLDSWVLADSLNSERLPGVTFRALPFEPTFNKHAETLCGGCFTHVIDRNDFRPVLTFAAVMTHVKRLAPDDFAWKSPPYEYEYDKMPIDILAGSSRLRVCIDGDPSLHTLRQCLDDEETENFDRTVSLLYI